MSKGLRLTILALVLVAALGAVLLGQRDASEVSETRTEATGPLPRLVDLGSDKCIPCQRMAPILADLAEDFSGRLEVEVIDVRVNPSASDEYGIRLIPTQIFYNAQGEELWRHEGFYDRASILAKCEELGLDIGEPGPQG